MDDLPGVGNGLWSGDKQRQARRQPGRSSQPRTDDGGIPALPDDTGDAPALTAADSAPALDGEEQPATENTAAIIHVQTDVLDVDISTIGGTLTRARLLVYPVHKDEPDTLVQLLSPAASELGLIRTGLNDAGDGEKADHNAIYAAAKTEYELGGGDELVVPLTWSNAAGHPG